MAPGPIVIIEDDKDDKEIFEEVLKELNIPNELIWFRSCDAAYSFLDVSPQQPFIIFSDINLPGMTGIEFKRKIDDHEDLRKKSIPFVFYSNSIQKKYVDEAYNKLTVQGFFQKGDNYDEMKKLIRTVIEYWKVCRHPNSH